MIKAIVLFKRKAGLSLAEFREHYEGVYVPLTLGLFSTIRKSVRNYIIPNTTPPGAAEPDFDCITEVWFDDIEGYQAMIDISAGDAGQAVIHCQKVFLDETKTVYSFVEEVESEIG